MYLTKYIIMLRLAHSQSVSCSYRKVNAMLAVTTMTSGQAKRVIEIMASSVPTGLSEARAKELTDGALRSHLANFWSAMERNDEVYEVTPLYSFAELTKQYNGIVPSLVCDKALRFSKPTSKIKPVRLKILKSEDVDEYFQDVLFIKLGKELEKVGIKVASACEMLGLLAQECIAPSDALKKSVIALGDIIKDPTDDLLCGVSASRGADKIHCGLMPAKEKGIKSWGFDLLVHA